MPCCLTCEDGPDFPIPNAASVAARLKELSANGRPALLYDIARSFDCGTGAIESVLRRAERNGIVQCVGGKECIAT